MSESGFSAQSTAAEVAANINLSGKVAVVTGGASGLGEETARVLAARGAEVVIAARDLAKADAAIARIRESLPAAHVGAVQLELADLRSVRSAAATLLECYPKIHLLINNAGIMACPLARTAEGCELQFGTNHIGHFLLTCLLVPALRAAAPARVVNLSSAGHKYAPVDFDDPHFQHRDYDKWIAYGQSKTANALFSVALNRRLAAFGITANAVHPGAIVTNLGRHMTEQDYAEFGENSANAGLVFKEVAQGAATSVWAATAPELAGRGGLYLEDCHIGEPATENTLTAGYLPYALDERAAEKLWVLSEAIVGQQFEFK